MLNGFSLIGGRLHWPTQTGNRFSFTDTGIKATRFELALPGVQFPLKGMTPSAEGLAQAANILAAKFPKANISFISPDQIYNEGIQHLSSFGYAEMSIMVNDRIAVHPLLVLVRDFHGRHKTTGQDLTAFEIEFQSAAPGLLADIL